jgi:hypothetical protein
MRFLDLYDYEVGSLCMLCGKVEAVTRDDDAGPVCSECMIDLLRAERGLPADGVEGRP